VATAEEISPETGGEERGEGGAVSKGKQRKPRAIKPKPVSFAREVLAVIKRRDVGQVHHLYDLAEACAGIGKAAVREACVELEACGNLIAGWAEESWYLATPELKDARHVLATIEKLSAEQKGKRAGERLVYPSALNTALSWPEDGRQWAPGERLRAALTLLIEAKQIEEVSGRYRLVVEEPSERDERNERTARLAGELRVLKAMFDVSAEGQATIVEIASALRGDDEEPSAELLKQVEKVVDGLVARHVLQDCRTSYSQPKTYGPIGTPEDRIVRAVTSTGGATPSWLAEEIAIEPDLCAELCRQLVRAGLLEEEAEEVEGERCYVLPTPKAPPGAIERAAAASALALEIEALRIIETDSNGGELSAEDLAGELGVREPTAAEVIASLDGKGLLSWRILEGVTLWCPKQPASARVMATLDAAKLPLSLGQLVERAMVDQERAEDILDHAIGQKLVLRVPTDDGPMYAKAPEQKRARGRGGKTKTGHKTPAEAPAPVEPNAPSPEAGLSYLQRVVLASVRECAPISLDTLVELGHGERSVVARALHQLRDKGLVHQPVEGVATFAAGPTPVEPVAEQPGPDGSTVDAEVEADDFAAVREAVLDAIQTIEGEPDLGHLASLMRYGKGGRDALKAALDRMVAAGDIHERTSPEDPSDVTYVIGPVPEKETANELYLRTGHFDCNVCGKRVHASEGADDDMPDACAACWAKATAAKDEAEAKAATSPARTDARASGVWAEATLEALERLGRPASLDELVTAVGVARSTVEKRLAGLIKAGKVHHVTPPEQGPVLFALGPAAPGYPPAPPASEVDGLADWLATEEGHKAVPHRLAPAGARAVLKYAEGEQRTLAWLASHPREIEALLLSKGFRETTAATYANNTVRAARCRMAEKIAAPAPPASTAPSPPDTADLLALEREVVELETVNASLAARIASLKARVAVLKGGVR
jgi:DNA-binding MarR family transcriptional regulator/predicted transcriptional regulator